MTSTLTSRTGTVHHAPAASEFAHSSDGTLCNGVGASRGQVRWYWRKGVVSCKGCLKVIAKAHAEALRYDQAIFGGATVKAEDTPPARSAGSSTLPQAQRTPSGAPHVAVSVRAVELEEDGTFPVITPVGSTTTHAGRYEGHFTVPVCTGKRLADAGYGLTTGTSAADVSCQRCKPLAPPAPKPVRRPQIDHKRCEHPATPRARRACRTAQRALEAQAKYAVDDRVTVKLDDAAPMPADILEVKVRASQLDPAVAVVTYVVKTVRNRTVCFVAAEKVLGLAERGN